MLTVVANSPRRGINFVTNKVVLEAVRIKLGLSNGLLLGNLDAVRDWGHAKDYVEGMWRMLQEDEPDDYVLATGVSKSVRELVTYVFGKLELDVEKFVKSDVKFQRAEELHLLKGDSSKALTVLGWKPTYTFETMIDEMIDYWLTSINTGGRL
jgi:GDPmannose 4,6-dehydratase